MYTTYSVIRGVEKILYIYDQNPVYLFHVLVISNDISFIEIKNLIKSLFKP